jgi:hypothetical protein
MAGQRGGHLGGKAGQPLVTNETAAVQVLAHLIDAAPTEAAVALTEMGFPVEKVVAVHTGYWEGNRRWDILLRCRDENGGDVALIIEAKVAAHQDDSHIAAAAATGSWVLLLTVDDRAIIELPERAKHKHWEGLLGGFSSPVAGLLTDAVNRLAAAPRAVDRSRLVTVHDAVVPRVSAGARETFRVRPVPGLGVSAGGRVLGAFSSPPVQVSGSDADRWVSVEIHPPRARGRWIATVLLAQDESPATFPWAVHREAFTAALAVTDLPAGVVFSDRPRRTPAETAAADAAKVEKRLRLGYGLAQFENENVQWCGFGVRMQHLADDPVELLAAALDLGSALYESLSAASVAA